MIRKVLSKLPNTASAGRAMNYALKKAEMIGGSEAKFENTSVEDYNALGMKKFDQVNNKYENKNGRKQEVTAIHEMISFHKDDDISPQKALDLAMGVWKQTLDLDNRKYRYAVHTDTEETHVHLIWNKRDNQGKIYNQKDDYALFEKLLYETEIENDLTIVKNRKFLNPLTPTNPQPSNEYRHEQKGLKSEKSKFKDEVKSAIDNAMSSSDFLEIMDARGFSIIHNGNNAYTLEKDGIGFKASDVGASYKHLKGHFGDDPDFPATLARLGKKTPLKREYGSLSGPQFQSAQDYEAKQKKNRVLDFRFDTQDGQSYKWNGSNREAFTYDNGSAKFYTTSPTAIKAGFQRIAENAKNPKDKKMHISGTDDFKRNAWLEFHKMNLDQKGFVLFGYEPTSQDKLNLENIKNEQKEKYSKANAEDQNNEKPEIKDKNESSGDKLSGLANAAANIANAMIRAAVTTTSTSGKYGEVFAKAAEVEANRNLAQSNKASSDNKSHQEGDAEKSKRKRRRNQLKPQ
ncbi:relaxase/mobilization nuclease domain-containing protein [Pseudomonas aeruginosa]|uniref:relaxase/mobilization nuclease domain-containing protein n=1 Tax=Pseudomonas aeruginosa TaxID=287 RepID=UPI0009A3480E|nr:relaxase/mobilization nuclease domain-containing protein [Pseudomonas aeruginosa]